MEKKKWLEYMFLLGIAFLFITLMSKNSFLYRTNDWWDANAFMTVGKGMMQGIIPYRDFFEQKGPVLYLLYGFASLISKTSFIGVYLFEILAFFVSLLYLKKIMTLFFPKTQYAYLAYILFMFSATFLKAFGHGGSAEEFTLPFMMISLYSLLHFLKTESISMKSILLNGVIAGIVLWIKYSLLGFWFIFEASVFFIHWLRKDIKKAFLSTIIFLGGMFVASIPWIVYFGIHHAIPDLLHVYFLTNMTSYAKKTSFLMKLIKAIGLLLYNLIIQPAYLFFITLPFIYLLKKKKTLKYEKVVLLAALLFTGLGAYIGGTNYFYYGYILTAFNTFGILSILTLIEKKKIAIPKYTPLYTLLLCIILLILLTNNPKYILKKKSDYAQFTFKESITDDTLLNYHCLDLGLYTTTGITPKYYYFMRNNIPKENYPEMYEEQDRYIKESIPKFVITKRKYSLLDKDYVLIKTHTQPYENRKVTYYLYERKENA